MMSVQGWTDGNEHDPGVTLLQVFAWLAGALMFTFGLYLTRRRRRCSP